MRKLLFIFIFAITVIEIPRELSARRFNDAVLQQEHVYNSTVKIEILKNLSAWDKLQLQQNGGRLFIRDKIIHE